MRPIRAMVVGAALVGVALSGGVSRAADRVDDAGRHVDLPTPPARVVTLAPNLTEIVYAVGAGAALVGTVDTSDYPAQAKNVPRIGDAQRLDVERLLALRPDLVFVWYHGNQGRELEQLAAAGVRMFYLEPRRLDDVARAMERVGELLGHAVEGRERAARYREALAALRAAHAGASPVSVFYEIWARPLMTLNGRHLASDILSVCGGRNVFADLPSLAPQVSVESVVAARPEAIFIGRSTEEADLGWIRNSHDPRFAPWRRLTAIPAVQRGWLFSVPSDLVTRPGPRTVEGVRAVCGALDLVRRERPESGRP